MRPKLRLLTAGVGAAWEAALVRACQAGDLPAEVVQRCYDLGDLLAAATAGHAEAAMVAATTRWLDREALARLSAAGLAVIPVIPAGDDHTERRLRQLGITHLAHDNDPPTELLDLAKAVLAAAGPASDLAAPVPPAPGDPHGPQEADEALGLPTTEAVTPEAEASRGEHTSPPDAALVAVWGPKGAPGRTTIATNLAFEAVPLAGETLLVDADTYGGTVAQLLGFLEDYPGLAWAARLASRGELDAPKLWAATRRAGAYGPRVLVGLARADLWTEVRPVTWEALLGLFRAAFPVTVIDLAACLEEDEELLYDHVRFRRNSVARMTLQQADTVVAVARADPVGLHDFIRGYQELRDLNVPVARIKVVVNQVRPGPFGGERPAEQVRAALLRYLGVEPAAFIPYDRAGFDAALMGGQALREARPGSAAQAAIADLTAAVLGCPQPSRARRRTKARRPRRLRVRWNGTPTGPSMTWRGTGVTGWQ